MTNGRIMFATLVGIALVAICVLRTAGQAPAELQSRLSMNTVSRTAGHPGFFVMPRKQRSVSVSGKREFYDVKTRLATPQEEAIDKPMYDQIRKLVNDEEIMAEIPESDVMGLYKDFDNLLEENKLPSFDALTTVTGTVISLDSKGGAYVDVGAKSLAYLPRGEISMGGMKAEDVLFPGLKRDFTVSKASTMASDVVLSIKRMLIPTAWTRVRQMAELDVTLSGKILSHNRGGFIIEVDSLQGFLPFSQMATSVDKDEMIGKVIPVKFLEVDMENQRLVMSNRRAVASSFKKNYKVGDVVVGTVTALKPYGAFINLGGVNGLLHISQISHDHVTSVKDVMDVGQKLKVMIMSRDQNGRVSLSTKRLEPNAGDMLRSPQLVFEKAEEMAARFKEQARAAEEATRALSASTPSESEDKPVAA
uniref:Ribosomal protein rpS1 n=1 Tax=Bigelowiella natans TaxID=227086 RepID=Q7XYL3_BIGNA|nr:ribosomal protein rpS1 [Bigelowiella natans]|eukprot:jgi/Bigna1/47811/estExt_Genewise1.C_190020